jgi:hypothetical protein
MTTLTIKSNSDEKTLLLVQLAEELGLFVKTDDFVELDSKALARGIGRKASDEELVSYLSQGKDAGTIEIEKAFSKYSNKK